MVNAIVSITVEASSISDVSERVADIPCVREAYSCSGDVDVLCILKVRSIDEIESIVPRYIAQIPGVLRTTTQIVYRTYSREESTRGFSLGIAQACP